MGVCPQFDIHHADLTAEEHLLFYARLKGVILTREKRVVEVALRQVGLEYLSYEKNCPTIRLGQSLRGSQDEIESSLRRNASPTIHRHGDHRATGHPDSGRADNGTRPCVS